MSSNVGLADSASPDAGFGWTSVAVPPKGGNRVTVHQVLPRCMVCGERLWERADWSPFAV